MWDNIMVDIETLGTQPDAAIVTIGAAAFNFDTGKICDELFYVNINPTSAQQAGCSIDAGTVMFWMRQNDEARHAMISQNALSLPNALDKLTEWITSIRASNPRNRLEWWGNSPSFDAVILEQSYRLCGKAAPWQFWETRDCRTMVALGQRYGFDVKRDMPREGTHHNAADDAKYQAQYVMAIMQLLDSHHASMRST